MIHPAAWPQRRSAAAACALVLVLVASAGLASAWQAPMRSVREHDAWTDAWQRLDVEFPANDSAIVASYSWAHVKWFFPDHVVWSRIALPAGTDYPRPWTLSLQTQHHEDDEGFYTAHLEGPSGRQHPIPANIKHVVVFDFQLAGENGGTRTIRPEIEVRPVVMSNGWRVLVFDTDAGHPTIESCFLDGGNTYLGAP